MARKRAENREGSLGFPGFVKPVFTKDKRRRRIPFDFQRTSLGGLALESATSSGLGRAPALQCRTPSRHHLELQDRRDYAPADRAARTCWLGCPGLLYYLAA
ncbi:hypothetical protein TNCV_241181 [Trichonephila clavipes]|nr:hypothetical protein TNCV_241181 [Trichonephila clavipes]